MNDPVVLLSLGAFVTVCTAVFGLYLVFGNQETRRLRRRIRELGDDRRSSESGPPVHLVSRSGGTSMFDQALRRLPLVERVHLWLVQANVKMRVGPFLGLTIGLALFGTLFPLYVLHVDPLAAPVGALIAVGPLLWVHQRKVKRIKAFERQFPDALDILTSALRSGMAFSGAVQVVAEECAEPVSQEFTILFEETRLGLDTRFALQKLARRVDSKELHLFVIAVLLQRDTGGNLVEILENAAAVIRERLRILGDVRALTAQARLSGLILAALPVTIALFILVTAPDYMRVLVREPTGRHLLIGSIVLQVIGFLFMRRIARIKV